MSSSCACSCKYLHCSLPLLVTQDPQVLQSCLARGSVARLGRGGSTSDLRRRLCRCLAVHIRSTVTERKLSRRDVQFILCTIETVCYFSQTPNSELENGVAIFRGSSFSQNPMSKLGFWIQLMELGAQSNCRCLIRKLAPTTCGNEHQARLLKFMSTLCSTRRIAQNRIHLSYILILNSIYIPHTYDLFNLEQVVMSHVVFTLGLGFFTKTASQCE